MALNAATGAAGIDWTEFRRHIVRIDRVGSGTLGTGFFVAPGWVLTAAHVVYDMQSRAELPVVSVCPDAALGDTAVLGEVRARSLPPTTTVGWPFPDLALVQLQHTQPWVQTHPCVWLLDPRERHGDDLYSYGFSRREDDAPPAGEPARFVFQGDSGDGMLNLMWGQAPKGLSGAPLLCTARRAVVGVVSMTKDPYGDLGGWAAPVSALLKGDHSVGEQLAAWGRRILDLNRAAVISQRARWHAVMPVPDTDTEEALTRPWERGSWRKSSPPSAMLLAAAGVIPYLPRNDEIEHGRRWCEQPDRLAISPLSGPGGAGKTRLALELGEHMSERGWLAGLWRPPAPPYDRTNVATIPLPRLIIIDYAEEVSADALRLLLDKLLTRATKLAPARVILLTRTATRGPDVLREVRKAADAPLRAVLDEAHSALAVPALPVGDRRRMYAVAVDRIHRAWFDRPLDASFHREPDLTDGRYALPLEVLLEAFDHALSAGQPNVSRPAVDRALEHEEHHWDTTAPAALSSSLRRSSVALATLAGATNAEEADSLLAMLPELAAAPSLRLVAVQWLSHLYEGQALINPLRPDRLGESLLAQVLQRESDHGHGLLRRVLALPHEPQLARALEVLTRLAASEPGAVPAIVAALADSHTDLVVRAEHAAGDASADRPARLDLAFGLQRLLHGLAVDLEALAWAAPQADRRAFDLSMSCSKIGDLAKRCGQSGHAEALYKRAVAIRERLRRANPGDDEFASELSRSYSKIGAIASDWGQHQRAKKYHDMALEIRQGLAERVPDNPQFARDVAISLEKLGDLSRGSPLCRAELYRKALAIRQELCASHPDDLGFARDLPISYDRLKDLAAEYGDRDEERRLLHASLDIRRRLVESDVPNKSGYMRDLAASYDALGTLALDDDPPDVDEAERRFYQALHIRRELADGQPHDIAFAHDVLVSFDQLGWLAFHTCRAPDASTWFQRGLDGATVLFEQDPRNTRARRAMSLFLRGLACAAREQRMFDAAADGLTDALSIARELLAKEPENVRFARDHATFYEDRARLSADTDAQGAGERAATYAGAAVHIRRTLHSAELRRLDLAEDLVEALWLLAEHGDESTERQALAEIIEVLEPFERSGRISAGLQDQLDRARAAHPDG